MERISKVWRSALAMVLALCMVISFVPVAAFAAEEEINYVSIGDSMANGYGFAGYHQDSNDRNVYDFMTGKGMYGEGAYPLQFEQYLTELGYEVNHTKLATSAMLAEDLLYLLDGREEFNDAWGGYKDYTGTYTDEELKPYIQEAITEADVITMGIGNAAFGAFLLNKVTDALGVFGASLEEHEKVNFEDAIEVLELDAKQYALVMQLYSDLESKLIEGVPADMAEEYNLQDVIDLLAYTSATFIVNYKLLVEQILEMNPDVEIVLVGLLNTTYGMNVTDEEGNVILAFGDMMDTAFNALNAYVAGLPAVLQAKGVAEEAKLYYAAQPSPKFICQVFEEMLDNGWENIQNDRLSGDTIRQRNIDAYNGDLAAMIGYAVIGGPLPRISLEDVKAYEAIDFDALRDQVVAMGMGAYWSPWAAFLFTGRYGDQTTAVNKIMSVAIYLGIEESVARSTNTMDIPLDGLITIAKDISSVFTALGTPPKDAPESTRQWLVNGFLGNDMTKGMCKIYGLFKVGNGMSVHPTPEGHDEIAQSVINAYRKHTVQDETQENVEFVLGELKGFLEAYGPDAAKQAYDLWFEMGYQDMVNEYVAELVSILEARYTNYTEVVLPAMNGTVDALNAQKASLTAELVILKTQLEAKKAELEKVLAEQEIPEISAPDFSIDTEIGNNEQTEVPDSDCENAATELEAAIKDLEHAIAVVEALIADVTADINDMIALATEIAEAVASLEKTLTDVAAAAQALKDAVDAVVAVVTDDSAKGITKTFINAFNTAREAALTAAEALELLVASVDGDVAAIEAAVAVLEEGINALCDKFDGEKESILEQILAVFPEEEMMIAGLTVKVLKAALEAHETEIDAALEAKKAELIAELNGKLAEKETELNAQLAALEAEYAPKIAEAEAALNAKLAEVEAEIAVKAAQLAAKAEAEIAELEAAAAEKLAALDAELQGYVAQLNALGEDAAEDVRAGIQAQIDRVTGDIATVNADLECAVGHVNAALKAAHDAMVEEVNNLYAQAVAQLQKAHEELVAAYEAAVAELKASYEAAIAELKAAYEAAVKELEDAVKNAIEGVVEQVRTSLEELKNNLINLGIDSIEALVEAVTAIVNDMLYQATHADLELDGNSTYVALGDGTAATESYVEVLAAQLQAEYNITGYTNYAAAGNTVGSALANIGSYTDLADAELITLGFGSTTMLNNAFANAMSDDAVDYNWADLVSAELAPYVEDALAEVYGEIASIGLDAETTAMLNTIVEGVAYGAVEYAVKLPQLIAAIRQINADAVIVIVGQYNPMGAAVLKLGNVSVDVSEYIDYFVTGVAAHGIAYSIITGDAIFVEAPAVETTNTDMEWTVADLIKMLMNGFVTLDPSTAGDAYIANQILAALNITKVALWGDSDGNGKVTLKDAILTLQVANGKDVTLDRTVSDVTGDNKITVADAVWILKRANDHTDLFPVEK